MTHLSLFLSLLLPLTAVGQPPVPAKTIEARVSALESIRKQIESLEMQYAKESAELDDSLAALQKRLDDLKHKPTPVPPESQFLRDLKAAFTAEASATKLVDLELLKSLYRATVVAAKSAANWGTLFKAMGETAKGLGLTGKLQGTQQIVSRELVRLTVNPREKPDEVVTDEHRAALEAIVKALESLK